MEAWEALLFVFLIMGVGTGIFALVFWLVTPFNRESQTSSSGTSEFLEVNGKVEAPSVVKEQPKFTSSSLVDEVDNNLRVTSEAWTGDLVPFDTRIWDARQYEVYEIPVNVRNNLRQVYADINLANQIVWLSKEFNRNSPRLVEGYTGLRTSIAERLHRIKQEIE